MTLLTRILVKEAAEFAQNRGLLLLCFVAPVGLMLLVGNLNVRDPVIRVALVAPDSEQDELAKLQSLLEELSNIKVVVWPSGTTDARARSIRENVDLVIIREQEWRFYSPLTNRYRLQITDAVVQEVALSMEREAALNRQLELIQQLAKSLPPDTSTETPVQPTETPADSEKASVDSGEASEAPSKQANKPAVGKLVKMLEREIKEVSSIPTPVMMAVLSSRLVPYFPAVSNVDRSIVPSFIALIVVFLPFLLSSAGLVKEREAGMLETVVVAAHRNWVRVAAAKLLLAVCTAMITALLLLISARTAYGIGIKPGLAPALAVQCLAALGSALLGFSVSTLIKSQQAAYLTSALYLVGLILVTGLIYPIKQAGVAVILVSYAFPLTFSGPPFEAWMTQGADAVIEPWHLAGLLGQLVVFISLCALALWRAQRSL